MLDAEDAALETTDEALIRRSAAGDRAAFDQLVGRHGDALYRFAGRQCGSEREAEDALQDGLLAAWRGASTWRGEAAVRTWLYQVVLHACRRRTRRRSGEPAHHDSVEEAEGLAADDVSPDERVAARQAARALEAALASLPEEAREVLLLRDVEGLSGAEAAAVLGVGLAAMKSRLHRARLDLKERVEAVLGRPLEA
ncbi:MAG TPA: RNA polymerase sigma factor [Anaeromyxobacteraceae bacterium]|nr:RNA polymerase sigma factor [Anaeromyxobacteraceae bacterium]